MTEKMGDAGRTIADAALIGRLLKKVQAGQLTSPVSSASTSF